MTSKYIQSVEDLGEVFIRLQQLASAMNDLAETARKFVDKVSPGEYVPMNFPGGDELTALRSALRNFERING